MTFLASFVMITDFTMIFMCCGLKYCGVEVEVHPGERPKVGWEARGGMEVISGSGMK